MHLRPIGANAQQPRGLVFAVTATLGHTRGQRLRVVFLYTHADPYALQMHVWEPARIVRWCFARALLADGLNTPVGDGDVHITPSTAHGLVCIDLCSPSGRARLEFARADLEHLLERTDDLVPPGTESAHIDWEREWALLARSTR